MKPTLHLLMGLPGSGKTTLAKTLQKITKAARMSSDDYRLLVFPEPQFTKKEHDNLYGLLDHSVEHLLEAGNDVIYDANLNRSIHRQEKYLLAKKIGADVKLWWVQTPTELSRERRLREQDLNLVPEGETPELMFDRITEVFEAPNNDEVYIAVDGTKITNEYIMKLLSTNKIS